jgi:aarF domain-containing kinase
MQSLLRCVGTDMKRTSLLAFICLITSHEICTGDQQLAFVSSTRRSPGRRYRKDESAFAYLSTPNTVPSNTDEYSLPLGQRESPLIRATEIGTIMVGKVMSPLLASLFAEGLPSDWEIFWSRSVQGISNAERFTEALEELGPTYVKFGQAVASRPDVIPRSLADKLSILQDDMKPFDTQTAKSIVTTELQNSKVDPRAIKALVESLSTEPVAAASIGQVYSAYLADGQRVAVKVQRPGMRLLVERDAALLRTMATWIESIPALPSQGPKAKRLVATELVDAVDEFMSRIFEELDYRNEAQNAKTFAELYCSRNGSSPDDVCAVVPEIFSDYCSENVIVMDWLDGTKLTSFDGPDAPPDSLSVIKQGIRCTLRQLLVDGVLHADPHAGNLLKVTTEDNKSTLGYLDFGILSTIPSQVRDGLVCAVTQLVFAKDVDAVAGLFGELQLLPPDVLEDKQERAALSAALEDTLALALVYPDADGEGTPIPVLQFDRLLDALSRLIPRFRFKLPPYFINNGRALSTMEGIARSLDPSFNVLQIMYPYTLEILLQNPSGSPVVEDTLQKLIRSTTTGRVDPERLKKLLTDSALLTGFKKRRVVWDVLKTRGGRRITFGIVAEELNHRLIGGGLGRKRRKQRRAKRFYLKL